GGGLRRVRGRGGGTPCGGTRGGAGDRGAGQPRARAPGARCRAGPPVGGVWAGVEPERGARSGAGCRSGGVASGGTQRGAEGAAVADGGARRRRRGGARRRAAVAGPVYRACWRASLNSSAERTVTGGK